MWGVKTKLKPVITRAIGRISKIIQKIPEQNTWKAGHPRTTENSHIRHCTLTSENTDVKYQTFSMGSNITCAINCIKRKLQQYVP